MLKKMKTFNTLRTIRFHEADPAGILFFGRSLEMAHDHYEEWIKSLGHSFKDWFQSKEFIVPIRKSECEYYKPLFPGQEYEVILTVKEIGDSSFTTRTQFTSKEGLHMEVLLTHVFTNPKEFKKMAIPSAIKSQLEHYLEGSK